MEDGWWWQWGSGLVANATGRSRIRDESQSNCVDGKKAHFLGWHHFCNTTSVMIMEWDCADEQRSHFRATLGNSALDLKLCGMVSYLHKGL